MTILLLGGTGQVGREARARAANLGLDVHAPSRVELDLVAPLADLAEWLDRQPSVVINAAAYTDVDAAESDPQSACQVNAAAVERLSRETARRKIPLVHISTDYVFNGRKGYPYVEADATDPVNVYGKSKLAGENFVRTINPRHVIVRTSWVFSAFGRNFVKTMLRLSATNDQVRIVDDQRGCPTSAGDLALACLAIADRLTRAPDEAKFGTFHFAGRGETTWCSFASAIFATARPRLPAVPNVVPITTSEYPTPAQRPLDTRLDCSAINSAWDVQTRDWRESLAEVLDQLLRSREFA